MPFWIDGKCSHVELPKSLTGHTVAFAMKQKSPYRNMFNYFIFKLQESGQLSRMWKEWKGKLRQDCFEIGVSGLGILNVLTAFFILGGAFLLINTYFMSRRTQCFNVSILRISGVLLWWLS